MVQNATSVLNSTLPTPRNQPYVTYCIKLVPQGAESLTLAYLLRDSFPVKVPWDVLHTSHTKLVKTPVLTVLVS